MGLPGGSVVKNLPANAGDAGSIPGSGRSPAERRILTPVFFGEGNGTPLRTLAWRIPWMEEPGGLQSMGSLGVGHD